MPASCGKCHSMRGKLNGGGRFQCYTCGKSSAAVFPEPQFEAAETPSELPSYEELVATRLKSTKRKLVAGKARELIDLKVHVRGPYGIALIGDPHIDNPGCNLQLLLDHTDLIARTPGLFAICVGDLQDNWIGRLARLWSGQGISAAESQVLVDGWLRSFQHKLLALVLGNHDCWAAGMSGLNPTDWIKAMGTVQDAHGVRLRVTTDGGDVRTINARHDFPGRSQYNAAHGPNKSLLFGCRDDVAVAGHTHEFGFGVRLNPETRTPMHAVRLGSYKHSDEYASQLGLMDNNVTECAVLMVDPAEPDPRHRTWIETNPFRAARVLTQMRADRAQAEPRGGRAAASPAGRGARRPAAGRVRAVAGR